MFWASAGGVLEGQFLDYAKLAKLEKMPTKLELIRDAAIMIKKVISLDKAQIVFLVAKRGFHCLVSKKPVKCSQIEPFGRHTTHGIEMPLGIIRSQRGAFVSCSKPKSIDYRCLQRKAQRLASLHSRSSQAVVCRCLRR